MRSQPLHNFSVLNGIGNILRSISNYKKYFAPLRLTFSAKKPRYFREASRSLSGTMLWETLWVCLFRCISTFIRALHIWNWEMTEALSSWMCNSIFLNISEWNHALQMQSLSQGNILSNFYNKTSFYQLADEFLL